MFDFTLLLVLITFFTGLVFLVSIIKKNNENNYYLVELAKSLFPILLIVLIIRSFIIEPFRIPSGSMIPTLIVGDFILVNKFKYGLKLPLTNQLLINNKHPTYGDIIVFQYPLDKKINYIKRVVALPGDKIDYVNKIIYINGKEIKQTYEEKKQDIRFVNENNFGKEYKISLNKNLPTQNFSYSVPNNSYFVFGDNRDNSNDSRYWGPVPQENIIGEAFMIWMFWNLDSSHSISDRVGISLN